MSFFSGMATNISGLQQRPNWRTEDSSKSDGQISKREESCKEEIVNEQE
jgi:hypothetical protein